VAEESAGGPLTFSSLAARIVADPRFEPAAARLCRAVLDFYAAQPLAMRLLGDQGQMRVAVACHFLDPGITVAAVQRLVPPAVASPGRVEAIIQFLYGQRALEPVRSVDRRARHYRLTAEARALVEAFLLMMVGVGAPFARTPLDSANCRAWGEEFLLATLEGGASLRAGPTAERAQTRRGGALLNLELMRRRLERDPEPFSRRAFAARFGLPRTQVIDLVEELRQRGWIEGSGGLQPSTEALAGGRVWLSRFLAISATVLDGRFGEIVANSRAEPRAGPHAARPPCGEGRGR
jgi:hypothetical protein